MGENVKNKKKDGTLIYELGVIYFESCNRDKTEFNKMDSWWLVDVGDIVHCIDSPIVEKISGTCVLYLFNLEQPNDENKGQDTKDA